MTSEKEAHLKLGHEVTHVFTEDLALQIRAITDTMPDEFHILALGAKWNSYMESRARKLNITDKPPQAWIDLMDNMEHFARIKFCTTLNVMVWRQHTETIGDLREFAAMDGDFMGIGDRGKAFLALAFPPSDRPHVRSEFL